METRLNGKELIGKTITSIDIDGFGITLRTFDGLELNCDASDGGYSSWEISNFLEKN